MRCQTLSLEREASVAEKERREVALRVAEQELRALRALRATDDERRVGAGAARAEALAQAVEAGAETAAEARAAEARAREALVSAVNELERYGFCFTGLDCLKVPNLVPSHHVHLHYAL